MGSYYDDPELSALTLTRMAAEESEIPGEPDGRMRDFLEDLAARNGAGYLAEVAIALARGGFVALDELARATETTTEQLLDSLEVQALEGHDGG